VKSVPSLDVERHYNAPRSRRPTGKEIVHALLTALVIALAASYRPADGRRPPPTSGADSPATLAHRVSSVASQPLVRIRWQTPVDLQPQDSGGALLIHYGSRWSPPPTP